MYSIAYLIISNLAIACCFLPVLIIFARKVQYNKAFLFTAIYWMANGLQNLPVWMGQSSNQPLTLKFTLLYNILDAPLLLLVFIFSTKGVIRKIIGYTLLLFIVFEAIIIITKGYNVNSSTIIVGVGTFFAITYSIMGIMDFLHKEEPNPYENTMVFVYASFLFDYGVFIVIYLFSYLKIAPQISEDTYLIYYISLLLSTAISSLGLWIYAGRTRWSQNGSIPPFPRNYQ